MCAPHFLAPAFVQGHGLSAPLFSLSVSKSCKDRRLKVVWVGWLVSLFKKNGQVFSKH